MVSSSASARSVFSKLIGIDNEYTRGDRLVAWSVFIWSFGWTFGVGFVGVALWNWISPWGKPGDVVLGYFNVLDEAFDGPDATDEAYFMVVNGLTEPEGAAQADTRQRITLNFNSGASGISSLQRLSRDTGMVEAVPLVHDGGTSHHLDLTLDGGAGDLFKFSTGAPFVSTVASTWRAGVSGDRNIASNWFVAEFGSSSSTRTVFSESAVTVGSLKFDSASTYQIAGNGSLCIDVSTGSGSITVVQGTHKINLPLFINDNTTADIAAGATMKISDPLTLVGGATLTKTGDGALSIEAPVSNAAPATMALAAGTTTALMDLGTSTSLAVRGGEAHLSSTQHLASLSVTGGNFRAGPGRNVVLSTKSLTISGSGVVDLQDGRLIVDYTGSSALVDVKAAITAGKLTSSQIGGNRVMGHGEASDLLAGESGLFAGEMVDSTSVVTALTIMGDASLDGQVNSGDFNQFVAHYAVTAGARWTQGDFDGDGKVTNLDFNVLTGNFGGVLPGGSLGSVVPDPASAPLLLAAAAVHSPLARRSRLRKAAGRTHFQG